MKNCIHLAILLFVALAACCMTSSCKKQNAATEESVRDKKEHPTIVVVPIIDSSGQSYRWNLSEELTYTLWNKLTHSTKLALGSKERAQYIYRQLDYQHNPFGNQITWTRQLCPTDDFALFLELIEHEEIPMCSNNKEDITRCPTAFRIALRIRLLDLRNSSIKIVLQEIIREEHQFPRPFTKFHFYQAPWGDKNFCISPIGLAHTQLINKVSARIEEYITLGEHY
jgi:hypothetical protein